MRTSGANPGAVNKPAAPPAAVMSQGQSSIEKPVSKDVSHLPLDVLQNLQECIENEDEIYEDQIAKSKNRMTRGIARPPESMEPAPPRTPRHSL